MEQTFVKNGISPQVRKTEDHSTGGFGWFLLFIGFIFFSRGFILFPFLFFLLPFLLIFSLNPGSDDDGEIIAEKIIIITPEESEKKPNTEISKPTISPEIKEKTPEQPTVKTSMKESEVTTREISYCPFCGSKAIPNGKYCWNCGIDLR